MNTTIANSELMLERWPDGRLVAIRDGEARVVTLRQAFPWSEPGRFLSLRDADDEEVALVESAVSLDTESRRALEAAVLAAGFMFEIIRVVAVNEEVEVRHWRVETSQGPRTFQTRLDDWPRVLPGHGLLIRDVAGDLYHVADAAALDEESRALLWAFAD